MPKLNDTQLVLLAHAAKVDSASLYPLPASLDGGSERLTRAVTALRKRGLVEERETSAAAEVHRTDGDQRYGLYVTVAGLAAIGIAEDSGNEAAYSGDPAPRAAAPAVERVTKSAAVLKLLQRQCGATLPELIKATGWLPHTTRAALTGLRKKGYSIARGKRDEHTCYSIVAAA